MHCFVVSGVFFFFKVELWICKQYPVPHSALSVTSESYTIVHTERSEDHCYLTTNQYLQHVMWVLFCPCISPLLLVAVYECLFWFLMFGECGYFTCSSFEMRVFSFCEPQLTTRGKNHHSLAVGLSKAELNLWFALPRTLKLMGQPLSLACFPVCSAPPAVEPYLREKPFSGPLP